MGLQIGDKVIAFSAKNDQGSDFYSQDLVGKKPFVIYFYPKNFTPGCTKEACSFRDNYEEFKSLGVDVIGVSSDSIKSHKKFKDSYKLPFTFLSDHDGKIRKLFGVSSGLLGILPGRETYVIDKNGVVRLKFNSMNVSKHIREAIATVKEMINE